MKQNIRITMLLVPFVLLSIGLFAQLSVIKKEKEKPRFPRWVSEVGYWVVETNINSPRDHVISFYTNDNILMYKETLADVKLNPEKRSVKIKLKKTLESSVITWYKQKRNDSFKAADQSFVKSVLK